MHNSTLQLRDSNTELEMLATQSRETRELMTIVGDKAEELNSNLQFTSNLISRIARMFFRPAQRARVAVFGSPWPPIQTFTPYIEELPNEVIATRSTGHATIKKALEDSPGSSTISLWAYSGFRPF
jgi:hypothetical protein